MSFFEIALQLKLHSASNNQSAELDALRVQVARLQAEKNDLVAMNSELQLKAEQDSRDDSFIEIIKVSVRTTVHQLCNYHMMYNTCVNKFGL